LTGENDHAFVDPQPGGRQPAPGRLGLLQAFLNTRFDLSDPGHGDLLTSPGALAAWFASRGLPGERRLSRRDLDRALAIREGLRALAFCNNGRALDPGAVDELRQASKGIATEVRLGPDGPDFVPVDAAGADPALGVLLASAAGAMIDGGWERLKACPGRDCGWVFFDQSRNGSARWCSMKVCGDREKARAYYRRRTR